MISPVKNKYVSIRLIGDRLLRRGYKVTELPLSTDYLVFKAPNGRTWLTKKALVSYPFISLAAAQIGRNKQLSCEFAAFHGAVISKSLLLPKQLDEVDDFLASYAPVIVKPLSSFSSHGLTMDIMTRQQLDAAVVTGNILQDELLVQQQFKGTEIRFMIIEGEMVACVKRENAQVVGDGRSSVQQLIVADNDARRALNFEIVPYPVLDETLIAAHFLHDQSVPAAGEIIELNNTSLVNEGGSYRNVIEQVHESYKRVALDLATALNPAFAGVDLLIQDYTQPMTPENYVFLEFTFAPSLRLFYDVRSGKDYDIVEKLAAMIDEYCAS